MNWRRFVRWLAALTLVACATLLAGGWLAAGMLLAPVNQPVEPLDESWQAESATLESESASQLAAWYVPPNPDVEPIAATVVLLHPIDGNRRSMVSRAGLLRNAGYTLVLIDMQAHGESPGQAIAWGHRERYDAQAAVAFAKDKKSEHKIAVVGRSLGAAAAVLGSPLGIDALVLEAAYPTIEDAVRDRIRIRLGPLCHVLTPLVTWPLRARLGVSASDLRPIDQIDKVDCPLLILAGDLDQHTTVAESWLMFEAAREPKDMVIFPAAPHGDLLAFDHELYAREVLAFFAKHLKAGLAVE